MSSSDRFPLKPTGENYKNVLKQMEDGQVMRSRTISPTNLCKNAGTRRRGRCCHRASVSSLLLSHNQTSLPSHLYHNLYRAECLKTNRKGSNHFEGDHYFEKPALLGAHGSTKRNETARSPQQISCKISVHGSLRQHGITEEK